MSEQDSFIDEVNDEVRRDRLYALLKRYGWIAVLAVILIVGGAAFNEYRKAQARAKAEALGDKILAALDESEVATRAEGIAAAATGEGTVSAVATMLSAAQATPDEGRDEALRRLESVASDASLDPVYRDLATIKSVLLAGSGLAPEARIERLAGLTAPGAPYRILALELTAYAEAEMGNSDEAISILTDLLSDAEASQGLRQRATQMIVALGGSLDAS